MNITRANGKSEYAMVENLKKRAGEADAKVVDIVKNIINSVKEQGDEAVREFTARFDGAVPKKTVIEKDELQGYLDMVDDDSNPFSNFRIYCTRNEYTPQSRPNSREGSK